MPKKGFESVTISEKHFLLLSKLAKMESRSLTKQTEFLIDKRGLEMLGVKA